MEEEAGEAGANGAESPPGLLPPPENVLSLPDSHVSRSSFHKPRVSPLPGLLPLPPAPEEAPKPPRPPNHPPPFDPWPALPDTDVLCLSLKYRGTLFDASSIPSMKAAAVAYAHFHNSREAATEFYDTSTGLVHLFPSLKYRWSA